MPLEYDSRVLMTAASPACEASTRTSDSFSGDDGWLDKFGVEAVHEDGEARGDLVRVYGLRQLNKKKELVGGQ